MARKTKSKRYSGEFRAKLALEAVRGDLTLAELGAKHRIRQTVQEGGNNSMVEIARLFSRRDRHAIVT